MTVLSWHSSGLSTVPPGTDWLAPTEADRLAAMAYPKRRLEAALGRWTAKTTIAAVLGLGIDPSILSTIVVRNAGDGAPEVLVDGAPTALVLAMSDRADWAVAAVRHGPDRIGCDLELVEPRSDRFVADYFTPSEQALVMTGDRDLMANLIWSAKESALKVLRTGLRRDTRSVAVKPDPANGGGWAPLSVMVDDGDTQSGWWIRYGTFVLTAVSAVPTEAPVAIAEPPPLASAVPGHAWMTGPLVGRPDAEPVRPGSPSADTRGPTHRS